MIRNNLEAQLTADTATHWSGFRTVCPVMRHQCLHCCCQSSLSPSVNTAVSGCFPQQPVTRPYVCPALEDRLKKNCCLVVSWETPSSYENQNADTHTAVTVWAYDSVGGGRASRGVHVAGNDTSITCHCSKALFLLTGSCAFLHEAFEISCRHRCHSGESWEGFNGLYECLFTFQIQLLDLFR